MKILFFIESLQSGGKERRLVELIKGLQKTGRFEIELVLTKDEIHFSDILGLDIKIHVFERKIKKDPRLFFLFLRTALSFKPDVIHTWGNLVSFYTILAKLILRVPLLNNQITDAPQKVKFNLIHNTLPLFFSDLIVANSEAGLNAYGVEKPRGVVIYNGFNFDRIGNIYPEEEVRKKFSITSKKIVGMVANYTDKKDYLTYLKAAEIVIDDYSDVTFLCVGHGDFQSLSSVVKEKYQNKIKFMPAQTDVESLINIFTIGVLATFTEGISNSVMEYMALGKPVIITEGGGSGELVSDGLNGYLIPPKSPQILAEKIKYLLMHEDKAGEFGDKSKNIIISKFSIESMVNSYIDIYSRISTF